MKSCSIITLIFTFFLSLYSFGKDWCPPRKNESKLEASMRCWKEKSPNKKKGSSYKDRKKEQNKILCEANCLLTKSMCSKTKRKRGKSEYRYGCSRNYNSCLRRCN